MKMHSSKSIAIQTVPFDMKNELKCEKNNNF